MVFLSRLVAQCALSCCAAALTFAAVAVDDFPGRPLSSSIPSESLPQALAAFVDQTGLQLVYLSTLTEGKYSQSAPTGLSPRQALMRMLSGTGIDFVFLNSRTIKLFKTAPSLAERPTEHPMAQMPSQFAALEEIVVTATKREEFLRDVPVSATVLSGQAMSEAGVTNIAEIAAMTPGVEYDFNSQWGGGVLTNVAIRGIDSKVGASTTGIYMDDAPIQARNGNFGNPYPVTFDLARVEVLRGPQGTLFGAGAEGGAIRFITNEPSTTTFSTLSRVELASTEYGGSSYEVGAAAGGPLVDGHVGARVVAWYRDDAGYIDRVDPFTGSPVTRNSNEGRAEAFRLSFAIEPSDSLRITPLLAYQSLRVADTSSFYEYLTDPAAGMFRNGKLLSQPTKNSFMLATTKLEYRFGNANLTASTSYFDRTATATIDTTNEAGAVFYGGFGNPLGPAYPTSYSDAVPTLTSLHQIVLAQEVRLMSADRNAPVRWMAGLFYSRAHQDERQYTYPIATPMNPGVYSNEDNTDTLTSGFGNLEVSISPRWRTRLGLRVDDARSEFSQYSGGFADVGAPPFSHAVTDEKPITPQFNVEFDAADHSLVYGTVAKGFRVGGINTALPIQCRVTAVPSSYASDSVWSYEIGAKRRSFDDRLQFSASAFYLRWNNIQEHEVPECGFGYVANAGDATGKGFDLTLDAALTDRMTVGLAAESVDVRYDETVMLQGKVIVNRGAIVGGVPHVPAPWNGTVYLRYQQPITAGALAYARAENLVHSHNPGPFSELDPKSISFSPRYTADPATDLLNLQLGVTWAHCDMRMFVNNALNSHPVLQRNADSGSSSLIYAYTFRPRTIGITSTWNY
jgi:outer membrane receptor protein involved in Fe transport